MAKKNLLLRINPETHKALRLWAEDEFRSLNAHIEFLLQRTLQERGRGDRGD